MSIWRSFTHRVVVKKLKKLGCTKDREAKGSHEIRYSPYTRRSFTMFKPHPGSKPFREGTLKAILQQAGITKERFLDV